MASFTALNGGDQKPMERGSGSPTNKRPNSEERPEAVDSGPTPRPSSRDIASNPRDQWPSSGPERSSYGYPDVEGSHKRKRSNSLELRREAPSAPEERTPAPPSHPEPRDVYGTSQHHERDYRPYGDENRGERSDPWYSHHNREERSAYETQNSAGSLASQSEGQGEDSLRRSQMDSQGYSPTSPDDESSYYGGSYTPEHRRDGTVIQSDPKKRKRNFSNRTKTGCLTCRKRKKKCDESKPECKWLPKRFETGPKLIAIPKATTVSEEVSSAKAMRTNADIKRWKTNPRPSRLSRRTPATYLRVHTECRSKHPTPVNRRLWQDQYRLRENQPHTGDIRCG